MTNKEFWCNAFCAALPQQQNDKLVAAMIADKAIHEFNKRFGEVPPKLEYISCDNPPEKSGMYHGKCGNGNKTTEYFDADRQMRLSSNIEFWLYE